ncbi:Myosin-11 [Picochlorum sp. SENEW3]|nr:Myosin-11 [Picochlorum sp. SENEW3]
MAGIPDKQSNLHSVGSRVWLRDLEHGWVRGEVLRLHEDGKLIVKMENGTEESFDESEIPLQNPGERGVEDMITLTYLNEPGVLWNLKVRYQQDDIYTYTGSILIAVNPFTPMPHLYGTHMMEQYKDALQGELSPHAYAIADASYKQMITNRKSQAILVSGESGAGKTETSKHIMQYLAWLGGELDRSTIEKDRNIEQKILESNPLLEAFGNAKTVRNDNSSRFGKFTEIQFDQNGRISGAAIRTYLLERSRVVSVLDPERNYHIFYQICDGASEEERNAWNLREAKDFSYLSSSSCFELDGVNNAEEYIKTRHAMDIVGIPRETQECVFKAVVAVLHLGNIVFEAVDDDESKVASIGEESLCTAASLLGVPVEGLRKILTTRTRKTVDGPIISPINVDAAINTRDSFAKTLYSRTFDWLVECINKSIGQDPSPSSLIGVLDIYGFEEFARNDFEQFCINFANEKLQQHFNQHVFKMEQKEYEDEGIEWSYIEFVDNQDVLDIIEGSGSNRSKISGILDLLDESCKFPRFTHKDFSQKLYSSDFISKSNRFFKPRLSETEFAIQHYAGKVQYDTLNFLEKNKDFIVFEHQELLSQSTEEFVCLLFPHEEASGSQASVKFSSVSSRFGKQLSELMLSLQEMEPHYIRCIKPNKDGVPMEFDNSSVLQQLRCGGVLEAVRISCAGYPSKRTYEEFYDHFWMMCLDAGDLEEKELSKYIIDKHLPQKDTQFGKSRVFLRAGRMAELEKKRMDLQNSSATIIQAYVKSWLAETYYLKAKSSILKIQSNWRSYIAQRELNRRKRENAAITIQSRYRSYQARRRLLSVIHAVETIQRAYRSYVHAKALEARKRDLASLKIQSEWRGYLARKEYQGYLRVVVLSQSLWRAKMSRAEVARRRMEARESGKLMKDKEALESKLEKLRVISETVTNQRNDLRKQLKEEKAAKEKMQSEMLAQISETNQKASRLEMMLSAANENHRSETEKLKERLSKAAHDHQQEKDLLLQEHQKKEQALVEQNKHFEGIKSQLLKSSEELKGKISELEAQLEKSMAQRDKAMEEAQIASGLQGQGAVMGTPMSGHLVMSRPALSGESYKDVKKPRSPYAREHISDMDRRQREILAKQQQLLREQRIADQELLMSALKADLGFQEERPVAAIVVFRSFVHWKVIQQDKGTIFERVSEAIGRQIEACPDDNRKLGYWLTNTCALYYLMQRHTKPAGTAGENGITARLRLSGQQAAKGLLATAASYLTRSPIKPGDGPDASAHGGTNGLSVQFEARYPALLFKQRLGVFVQEIFPGLRDNMKKEISGQLGICMNMSNTHGGRSAARRASKNPHDHENEHLLPWREILKSFTSLLDVLKEDYVPHLLASKLMEQLFTIINVNLFNQLMLKRDCCSFSNGEYVKLGLGEVEHWLEKAGHEWVGNSWDSLSHLRQAVTFLVIHQKAKKSLDEIRKDLCPSLTVQQIYRLSTMYWDDRFGTESVSHEVLSELKIIMNSAGQQSQNHSFLLDEDSAIPFSAEELSRTYDGLNLLQSIRVPEPLQQSDDERKDRFQFLTKNLITPSV